MERVYGSTVHRQQVNDVFGFDYKKNCSAEEEEEKKTYWQSVSNIKS